MPPKSARTFSISTTVSRRPIALLADARRHLIDAGKQLQAAVIRARQHHTTGPPSPSCSAPPDKPPNSASPGLDIHRTIRSA